MLIKKLVSYYIISTTLYNCNTNIQYTLSQKKKCDSNKIKNDKELKNSPEVSKLVLLPIILFVTLYYFLIFANIMK